MSEPETHPAAGETPDDGPLLEELRELIGELGQLRAAELLDVSDRTLQRTLASGRLTVHMRDTLKLRRMAAANERALAHIQTLEERIATLTAELREAKGETAERPARATPSRAAPKRAVTPPSPPSVPGTPEPVIGKPEHAVRPWRPWPDVVTPEPEDGEELVYGEAAPLIAEWREAWDELLRAKRRIDRLEAEGRLYELEIALIGKHGMTLPPATYPWRDFVRDDELRRRRQALGDVRADLRRAVVLRVLRRLLTLGVRRRRTGPGEGA